MIRIEINTPVYVCPFCLGSGKRKVMQSASTNNGSIRWKDTEVDCNYCKGTGVK